MPSSAAKHRPFSRVAFLILTVALAGTVVSTTAHAVMHPQLGRFLQRDPYMANPQRPAAGDGYQDGLSVYQYVSSKPTLLVDPSGERQGDGRDRSRDLRSRCERCKGQWVRDPAAPPPWANGCTLAPDKTGIPGVGRQCSFTPPCDTHDLCYQDCSMLQSTCDENFLRDLRQACYQCCSRPPHVAHAQRYCRRHCYAQASVYYHAVKIAGRVAYWAAQRDQCKCTSPLVRG